MRKIIWEYKCETCTQNQPMANFHPIMWYAAFLFSVSRKYFAPWFFSPILTDQNVYVSAYRQNYVLNSIVLSNLISASIYNLWTKHWNISDSIYSWGVVLIFKKIIQLTLQWFISTVIHFWQNGLMFRNETNLTGIQ